MYPSLLWKLARGCGAVGFWFVVAIASVGAQPNPSPSDIPDINALTSDITNISNDYKTKLDDLSHRLSEGLTTMQEADARLNEMRTAVEGVLQPLEPDSELDKKLSQYIAFAEAEQQRLSTSSKVELRELAPQWNPRIERASRLKQNFRDVRVAIRRQLSEIESRREVVTAFTRMSAFDKALDQAEAMVNGLQDLANKLRDLATVASTIEAGS